mmetsp:Transcript_2045/g.4264  ORF Transcript_2045/g.4264 Transcript_2045/m.4264 type:complete len:131 (+) Transcript_2045:59-451(+)
MIQLAPASRLILSRGAKIGSVLICRYISTPAMQLPILNCIENFRLHAVNNSTVSSSKRCFSHNPFNGTVEEERKLEWEMQKRQKHGGLKNEYDDFATTALDRAKMRLRASASERRRRKQAEKEARRNHSV